MSARPFTPAELLALESHLASARRTRDAMLLKVGANVGFRITELLTWTIGQVLTPAGEVSREVTVTRALLKGGSGKKKRSIRSRRVVLNEKAREAIRDYIASLDYVPRPEEFLFKSREGGNRPLHRSQAHRILVRACEDCGIDTRQRRLETVGALRHLKPYPRVVVASGELLPSGSPKRRTYGNKDHEIGASGVGPCASRPL